MSVGRFYAHAALCEFWARKHPHMNSRNYAILCHPCNGVGSSRPLQNRRRTTKPAKSWFNTNSRTSKPKSANIFITFESKQAGAGQVDQNWIQKWSELLTYGLLTFKSEESLLLWVKWRETGLWQSRLVRIKSAWFIVWCSWRLHTHRFEDALIFVLIFSMWSLCRQSQVDRISGVTGGSQSARAQCD